jgi:hypothetical protein
VDDLSVRERSSPKGGQFDRPVSDDDALDWRWVGEPESSMGLRSVAQTRPFGR